MERNLSKLLSPARKQSSIVTATPKESLHHVNKSVSFQAISLYSRTLTKREPVRPKLESRRPKPLGDKSTSLSKSNLSLELQKAAGLVSYHSPHHPTVARLSKHVSSKSSVDLTSSFRSPNALFSDGLRTAKATVRLGRHSEAPVPVERRALPLNSVEVVSQYRSELTSYEISEVLSFETVYFVGSQNLKVKDGCFDTEKGDYVLTIGDHIAYRYEVLGILGRGSFGIVARCKDHKHNEEVALKIIKNKKLFHQQGIVEVRILQTLRDKDKDGSMPIVLMKSSFQFRKHLCIVFEMLNVSLYDFLKMNHFQGLPLPLVKKLAVQLLKALVFIKKLRIIHCDLKPENILLKTENKSNIKLIDFGSSCFETSKVYSYIQSRFYRSPEIILGTGYNSSIDMWSFGCLLAEFARGMPTFPGENEKHQFALMMEVLGVPPSSVVSRSPKKALYFDSSGAPRIVHSSKGRPVYPGTQTLGLLLPGCDVEFIDLVSRCLDWNPITRITPEEALHHPWINEGGVAPIYTQVLNKSKTSSFLNSAKGTQRTRKISILM